MGLKLPLGLKMPRICPSAKFSDEAKGHKFGAAIAFLGFLDCNSKMILSHLKLAPSNWCNCKILRKKQKYLSLEPGKLYLGILGLKFGKKNKKTSCFKSAPSNLSNCKTLWNNENA